MRRLVFVSIVLAFLVGPAVGCRVWEELLGEDEDGLYIIGLDESGLRRLTGGDCIFLGWLDDNAALIKRQEELQALDIDSGEATTLISGRFVMHRLSPDRQRIAYLALPGAALHVAKVDGSEDRILAEGGGLNWFSWSPDSEHLVYNLDPDSRNYVVSVSGDEPARYVAEGTFPEWAPCERILVEQGASLYSVRPDGSGLVGLGETGSRLCHPNGEMLALQPSPGHSIQLVPIDGRAGLGTLTTGRLPGGSWSPDGSKLAVYRDDGERTLVIVDLATQAEVALVSTSYEEGTCWGVCWSPDSQWVAFSAAGVTDLVRNQRFSDGRDWDLYVARADGSKVRRLVSTSRWDRGCGWTPDGTRVTFWQGGPPEDGD